MADDSNPPQSGLNIPPDLKKQFPELIELILGSESMNDEERQYWINILPVMTPEQIDNLKNILTNEKNQLAAIDKKYAKEIEQMDAKESIRQTEEQRKERREERTQKEEAARDKEEDTAENLLDQIENL